MPSSLPQREDNADNQEQSTSLLPAKVTSDEFVTVKEFTDFQTTIGRQITDIKGDTELFGFNTGTVLIVSLVFNLILLAAVLFCIARFFELKDLYNLLKEISNTNSDKVESLSKDVRNLQKELSSRNDSPVANPISAPVEIHSIPQRLSFAPPPPPPKPEDKYKTFVEDFNALSNQRGYAAKEESDKFLKKYKVRTFSCINNDARMNEPIPPPEFAEAANGDYWAYEFESGTYAVVPKINTYSESYHSARAFGEVFSSNFDKGTYSKIFVRKPALFKGMWTLQQKGELELSR